MRGWLGDASPDMFIGAAMDDMPMPCHLTVDYKNEDWYDEMLSEDSNVEHCVGALIFWRNQAKMPRMVPSEHLRAVEKSDDVFCWKHEFLEHHKIDL